MRLLNLTALAASCLLAGNANVQQTAPVFGLDSPVFRTDCDDWATTLPAASDYWERTNGVSLSMPDAIKIAYDYAGEHYDFLEIRTLSAELRLSEKPFYQIFLLTHEFNEKKNKDVFRRWEVHVGIPLQRVKTWLKAEQFPGTPVGDVVPQTLPSGLRIYDIREGDGKVVTADSTVRVHFDATTLDGTLVFSTYRDHDPQTFKVSDAPIQGLIDGLPGARKGGKRKLIIPPQLAFGKKGFRQSIPPDATVVYDVEILQVLD